MERERPRVARIHDHESLFGNSRHNIFDGVDAAIHVRVGRVAKTNKARERHEPARLQQLRVLHESVKNAICSGTPACYIVGVAGPSSDRELIKQDIDGRRQNAAALKFAPEALCVILKN